MQKRLRVYTTKNSNAKEICLISRSLAKGGLESDSIIRGSRALGLGSRNDPGVNIWPHSSQIPDPLPKRHTNFSSVKDFGVLHNASFSFCLSFQEKSGFKRYGLDLVVCIFRCNEILIAFQNLTLQKLY